MEDMVSWGEKRERPARYDVLFEPVKIGPVTARNRFYQVPHCNGMGYRDPTALAHMRGVKAEGGWAVVCTEQVEFHHTSEITPFIELRLWDDRDIPALARMADKIHEHGSLAGIELAYNGMNGPNLYSREVPMGPAHLPVATFTYDPVQARRMDGEDIRNIRKWHLAAVKRARRAGFDLIYVYAAHALGFLHHFLSRRYNQRTDEYGGPIENRVRLLREITEETKEAVGDTCAVPVRISVDELLGEGGLYKEEVEDMIGLMADLPDLWDVTLAGWENDSRTSRFAEEGAQEPFIAGVRRLTSRPVVGVGRYTSVDRMVSLVNKGIMDMIGAARPSIADPFLPRKIEEGRFDDIRECIGCNICVSGDFTMSPIRCTQNPTMAEEWRKGWHPEKIRRKASDKPVLVVGAGPAGLEAAQALGKRGYDVTLAEAGTELGGRVLKEARLPGLSAWVRVVDYRRMQLQQLPNVETYFDSRLTADDILSFGIPRVAIATGATWRADGVGHLHTMPISMAEGARIFSPSDVMEGKGPEGGRVVVFDDDHYYMGGVMAEVMAERGCETVYVTPASEASTWTRNTMEQHFIQKRLLEKGVTIRPFTALDAVDEGEAIVSCVFTGRRERLAADAVLLVTARLPNEALFLALKERREEWADAGIESVSVIGDAQAPATIAHATYAGRRYAEELDTKPLPEGALPFRREITELLPLDQ
ncbi:oxidoreductase [Chelativorans intermedius]|uniref:FAD-dependent oxidoreductase n=1 Tax=Chelativorans intermedius TaxID=515947 RepID=A0ABV6D5H1_9HYPH|nr:FAD-dependent oxidoreductase [Chelativorans intermedius]MCT8998810.1 FAD-dependent oxidoreductase [Chelativorans intermedius]